jgi:hypothetical protein
MMKKIAYTILILAAAFLSMGAAKAQEAYDYPLCSNDPDVSCYTPEGQTHPTPSYESGQYPEGWYDQRYQNDQPNEFRKQELRSQGYGAYGYQPKPTPTPVYEAPVVEPTPEALASPEVLVASVSDSRTDDQKFLDMIWELLNRKV